jgi:hypothetical protein
LGKLGAYPSRPQSLYLSRPRISVRARLFGGPRSWFDPSPASVVGQFEI